MPKPVAIANFLNSEFIELVFLHENVTLSLDEVKQGWEKANALSPNKKAVVHLKTGKYTLLETDARDYVMNELKTWPAVAIQVDNLAQRLMGQVVINMTGKGDQIKLFNNEEKAKEWLKAKLQNGIQFRDKLKASVA